MVFGGVESVFEAAIAAQLLLLAYHQFTSLVDQFPFNGVRALARKQRIIESAVNGVLMLLPPLGYAFNIAGLMAFGVINYFVLFAIELVIWWVPYLSVPTGKWRRIYNILLALATSDFSKGDALERWYALHRRVFRGTITILPARGVLPVPNLEHCILHA